MRPDWLAEDGSLSGSLFGEQGFAGVAQPAPDEPAQLPRLDTGALGTLPPSIGTSGRYLSTEQIRSENILDVGFDMQRSGFEARTVVANSGFYDGFCIFYFFLIRKWTFGKFRDIREHKFSVHRCNIPAQYVKTTNATMSSQNVQKSMQHPYT